MRGILEDLYHGNISVTARMYRRNTPFAQASARITELEDKIKAMLPEGEGEMIEQLGNAYVEQMSASGLEDFVTGFRMGAQFLLAALSDDDGDFTPIAKLSSRTQNVRQHTGSRTFRFCDMSYFHSLSWFA